MKILLLLSSYMIPVVILGIVGYGMWKKTDVYDMFIVGAKDGIKTVVEIVPTLIGLMVAVGILRTSGFFDLLANVLSPVMRCIGFPVQLVPLTIVRLFSSSAATGLALDVFREYGPDSRIGMIASILMSCTETCFYTMSVYYIAAKVKHTRWTLAGALFSTAAGIIASVLLATKMH